MNYFDKETLTILSRCRNQTFILKLSDKYCIREVTLILLTMTMVNTL